MMPECPAGAPGDKGVFLVSYCRAGKPGIILGWHSKIYPRRSRSHSCEHADSCPTYEGQSRAVVGDWLIGLSAVNFLVRSAKRAESTIDLLDELVGPAPLSIPRVYTDGTYAANVGQHLLYLARRQILHDRPPCVCPSVDTSRPTCPPSTQYFTITRINGPDNVAMKIRSRLGGKARGSHTVFGQFRHPWPKDRPPPSS